MEKVRGGSCSATRARGRIAASASSNLPVSNETQRFSQGRSAGSLQPRLSARAARRVRYIRKIEDSDAPTARWALLLDRLGRQFDIDDELDRALDALVEVPPEVLAYYTRVSGSM
jgi:hypothetical protein